MKLKRYALVLIAMLLLSGCRRPLPVVNAAIAFGASVIDSYDSGLSVACLGDVISHGRVLFPKNSMMHVRYDVPADEGYAPGDEVSIELQDESTMHESDPPTIYATKITLLRRANQDPLTQAPEKDDIKLPILTLSIGDGGQYPAQFTLECLSASWQTTGADGVVSTHKRGGPHPLDEDNPLVAIQIQPATGGIELRFDTAPPTVRFIKRWDIAQRGDPTTHAGNAQNVELDEQGLLAPVAGIYEVVVLWQDMVAHYCFLLEDAAL